MAIVIPELGPGGWVTDPVKQLSIMFSDTLLADASQSTIFRGKVLSFTSLLHRYQNEPTELCQQIISNYNNYFSSVFDSSDVSCTVEDSDGVNYTLILSISVSRAGHRYDLTTAIKTKDGMIDEVLKEINK